MVTLVHVVVVASFCKCSNVSIFLSWFNAEDPDFDVFFGNWQKCLQKRQGKRPLELQCLFRDRREMAKSDSFTPQGDYGDIHKPNDSVSLVNHGLFLSRVLSEWTQPLNGEPSPCQGLFSVIWVWADITQYQHICLSYPTGDRRFLQTVGGCVFRLLGFVRCVCLVLRWSKVTLISFAFAKNWCREKKGETRDFQLRSLPAGENFVFALSKKKRSLLVIQILQCAWRRNVNLSETKSELK